MTERFVKRCLFYVPVFLLLVACGGQDSGNVGLELETEPATIVASVTAETVAGAPEETEIPTSAPASATPSAIEGGATPALSPATSVPATASTNGGNGIPAAPTTAFDPSGFVSGSGSNFPALDEPRMVSAAEAGWLQPNELVLGVEVNGESRAYPVQQAAYHHVINEEIAGEPYLVTF